MKRLAHCSCQWRLYLLIVMGGGALCVTPFIGLQKITPSMLWDAEAIDLTTIFWQLRAPRTVMAFLVGAGLSLSGLVFQAMFSNALATPYTLGIAGGAALGASIYIRVGLVFSFLGLTGQTLFAFVGAMLTMFFVYGLSRLRRQVSMGSILLAGVATSFFCSSLILFIQYLCGFTHLFRITRWLMGELAVTGFSSVRELGPLVFVGSVIIFGMGKELNLLTTGEELAVSRGLNVRAVKHILFFATSLMVGGIVACCGPIGFVGMMVPHICRLLVGADHRYLIPATFVFGGCFLTICDTLARMLVAPAEIPVGVITALLGGPFFVWLLVSDSKSV